MEPLTRIGVVATPGSAEARAVARAVELAGATVVPLPPDATDLDGVDAVILPGDTRADAPLTAIVDAAGRGLPVLGIGAGFAALCAAGVLPGTVAPNASGLFTCRDQRVRVESRDAVWTCRLDEGDEVVLPVRTAAGRYDADVATLERLEAQNQVVLRFVGANPTGSAADIAGITNAQGNVVGLVVHPENAVEALTGPSTDGLGLFDSLIRFVQVAA